jgi:hypothetical protein
MENEEQVIADTSEQQEGDIIVLDDIEDNTDEVSKAQEYARNQKIRAERAEKELKELKNKLGSTKETASTPSKNTEAFSQTDLIALIKADIPEDDISEVSDYAKLKGISLSEALKTSVVKTILAERKEERNTAQATSTGGARRGATKPDGNSLLANAQRGKMPEGDDDLDALIKARLGGKR